MAEEKKFGAKDMDTVRFYSLVSMFATSAYQSMGKIANPLTGKVERHLDGAQGMIDILIMLKNKTKGNLSKEEERILATSIADLQLNFVREKDKPEPEKEEGEKKEEESKKAAGEEKKAAPEDAAKREEGGKASGEGTGEKQRGAEEKKGSQKAGDQ